MDLKTLKKINAINLMDNVAGALPLSATFNTRGGTLLILVNAQCFSTTINVIRGVQVDLDGTTVLGQLKLFFNVASEHRDLAKSFVINGVSAGLHTINLTVFNGANSDFNDFFTVVILEL